MELHRDAPVRCQGVVPNHGYILTSLYVKVARLYVIRCTLCALPVVFYAVLPSKIWWKKFWNCQNILFHLMSHIKKRPNFAFICYTHRKFSSCWLLPEFTKVILWCDICSVFFGNFIHFWEMIFISSHPFPLRLWRHFVRLVSIFST